MDENYTSLEEIDKEKIRTAIRLHAPIEITSYSIPRQMEIYIHKILIMFLHECHQEHMNEYLNFCIGELLSNSKKANIKRVYFKEKNLDINNRDDYAKGMETFKEDTMANLNYYLTQQKKAGLYIKLLLQLKNDGIVIQIINNAILCEDERERIQKKLDSVKQYNNPDDVYKNVLDQTEGAGLGIIIIVLMLQKIGLSKENFKIYSTDKETITNIELPLNEKIQSDVVHLYEDFAKNQKTIPVIKSSFNQLEFLFNQTNFTKNNILEVVSKDVTLSLLLIKAAADLNKSCCNLSEAYDLIGIERVKKLYSKENTEINIIKKSVDKSELWEHSYNVAFFAYNLAKNFYNEDTFTADDIYLAALLHDIECVLIEAVSNTHREEFQTYYRELGISNDVIHMIYNNGWHSMGGSMLVKKWGLSDNISLIIENYKDPAKAPDNIKKVTLIIYIADVMQYYDEGKVEYYQIDKELLKSVGIENEAQLKLVIGKIKEVL